MARLLTAAVTSLPTRPYFIIIFLFAFVFILQQHHKSSSIYFRNQLLDNNNLTCQAPPESPTQRTYISPLCHCGKEVAFGDDIATFRTLKTRTGSNGAAMRPQSVEPISESSLIPSTETLKTLPPSGAIIHQYCVTFQLHLLQVSTRRPVQRP